MYLSYRGKVLDTVLELSNNSKDIKKEEVYSPGQVMRMLNSDNQEIQRLCKEVNIFPKKDNQTGKIFFFKNDVEVLKKIKNLHEKSQKVANSKQNAENKSILKQILRERIKNSKSDAIPEVKQQENEDIKQVKSVDATINNVERSASNMSNPIAIHPPEPICIPESVKTSLTSFNEAVNTAQETIIEKLSSYMDEKLDGLDDVVVDLIKCKVENERLKIKIEQLTKENYNLTTKLSNFTPVAFGLYMKKD